MPAEAIGLSGFIIGLIVGGLVYRARLCTFGAIEDALVGGDRRRIKAFGLAFGLAVLGTQALILFGALDPDRSTYVASEIPVIGLVLGGLMFGTGMALVGTCGFGSLVRLGSGDLRSLVVVLVFGGAAYATLRGGLSGFRINVVEHWPIAMPGPSRSDLPTQLGRLLGFDPRVALAIGLGLVFTGIALRDARLRRARRLLLAGLALGLAIPACWAATAWLSDPFALQQRVASLTFVAPVARAVFGLIAGQDSLLDLGVASVFGVACGAALASLWAEEFRWEAFDDQHEMRRHLAGAVLMGVGGVLAGGCTIGQGLAAGSLLALSMPIVLVSILIGARFGIAIMVGELREFMVRLRTE